MRRIIFVAISLSLILALAFVTGCDKEKIVTSTEIVKETEYITLGPDTVVVTNTDTVFVNDSVTVNSTDTVTITYTDTVVVTNTDTVVQTTTIHDTVTVTVTVHDTILTVQNHWDTVTVTTVQCDPNEYTAMGALQYHCDPLVMEMIQQEFGLNDGWIYYLTSNQLAFTLQSGTVFDIYGYIDYWTADWSGYYPLEFNWRLTFTGSDPGNPTHWTMSEAPAATPGLRILSEPTDAQMNLH